jgi:diguanylate cyclase (GGDEF)-like protein
MRFAQPRRLLEQVSLGVERPAIASTGSLMFMLGGIGALISVAHPFSPSAPVHLDATVGAIACLISLGLWMWGARLPLIAFEIVIAVGVAMESTIIAAAATEAGMTLTAFMYTWIVVYCAYFFPPRAVAATVGFIVLTFTGALLIDGLPNVLLAWLIVTCTVCALGFVLTRLNENLRHQAGTDHLTGLPNRSAFFAAAVRERAIADRSRAPLSIAVLDLDGFKQVNDNHGHAAGDRLLAEIASSWQECLRAGDVLARHGGDEFVLLLPGTSISEAREVLGRLRAPGIAVNWCAGVSEWMPGQDLDSCLIKADRELYVAKQSARPRGGEMAADVTLARIAS